MSEMGHSRPMHSVPVPINVRCYSNSDIIVRRSEVTLRAKKRLALRHVPAVHHEALDTGLAAEDLPLSDRNKLLHECLG